MKDERTTFAKVKELYKQGCTGWEISRKLGVGKNVAYYHINKLKHRNKNKDKYPKEKQKYTINWSAYNEGLVKRGEIFFEIDAKALVAPSELKALNSDKLGRPFAYTETLIIVLSLER